MGKLTEEIDDEVREQVDTVIGRLRWWILRSKLGRGGKEGEGRTGRQWARTKQAGYSVSRAGLSH